jgi:hypothetical protein
MKRSAALPIMLICLGCVWLLKSTALLPNTTTLLALLLFAAGVLLLALDGSTNPPWSAARCWLMPAAPFTR